MQYQGINEASKTPQMMLCIVGEKVEFYNDIIEVIFNLLKDELPIKKEEQCISQMKQLNPPKKTLATILLVEAIAVFLYGIISNLFEFFEITQYVSFGVVFFSLLKNLAGTCIISTVLYALYDFVTKVHDNPKLLKKMKNMNLILLFV